VVFILSSFDLGGTYSLHAKGNANVTMASGLPGYISNKTYDSSTNILTALIILPRGYNLSSQSNLTKFNVSTFVKF
jgi:hypothetical protein